MDDMNTFTQFALPGPLNTALEKMKFDTPTAIQLEAIPILLEGYDLIASAQTGSGKTAAFGIPAVASLLEDPKSKILILAPTRELVGQIATVMSDLTLRKQSFRPVVLIGGVSSGPQRKDIRRDPSIIIATPGRLVDHLEEFPELLSDVSMLVLDEADRMLEMGFAPQLKIIRKALPKTRQTLLFSATFPSDIEALAAEWLNEPKRVAVGSTVKPVSAITQVPLKVKDDQKLPSLLEQLKETDGLSLVFVRTKRRADKLTNALREQEIEVCQIHGGRSQKQREVALQGLRKGRFKVMIATDIAARGIDVPEISLVVNYDLPYAGEDYLHRIGRTARAGREGRAVCFITPQEESLWRSIERLMARTTGRSSKEQREDTEKHLKASKKSDRGGQRRDRGDHRGERSNSWKGSEKRSFRGDKRSTDGRSFNDSSRGDRSERRDSGRGQNFRSERSGEKRDFTPKAPRGRFGSSNERGERSFGDSTRGEQRGDKRSFSSNKNGSNDSRDSWSNRKPAKKKFGSSSRKPFGNPKSRGPKNSSRSSSRQR